MGLGSFFINKKSLPYHVTKSSVNRDCKVRQSVTEFYLKTVKFPFFRPNAWCPNCKMLASKTGLCHSQTVWTGLTCSQTEDYFKYHHRTFIHEQMKIEAMTHIRALEWAPNIQLKSGRSESMSKEFKTIRCSSTETVCLSLPTPTGLGINSEEGWQLVQTAVTLGFVFTMSAGFLGSYSLLI